MSGLEDVTERLLPTQSVIEYAEKQRVLGHYSLAFSLVQSVLSINQPMRSTLNLPEQVRYLTALRICFGVEFSLAKRAMNPFSLLSHLRQAHTIAEGYTSTDIKSMSLAHDRSMTGQPYDFTGEMARDIGRFLAFVQQLKGQGSLALTAILEDLSDEAQEPTLKTLMAFEAAVSHCEYLDSEKNLSLLVAAGREAIHASMQAQNFERAATVAARMYCIFPDGPTRSLAYQAYNEALLGDRNIAGILDREIKKASQEEGLARLRRILFTILPVDWSRFAVEI